VYERWIQDTIVMSGQAGSYVNASQILQIAQIEERRRGTILDKEILPGEHEVVKGSGAYHGIWLSLVKTKC
ncbi:hypothetical protein GYMLUDRAFT_181343, partial [Collybiopsis luxurians FD-317 M1]